ncbi:PAS domain S-box-containing protein/diguanylate cyclase (GGDEF) domain-containing protein [Arboricoccus pini]|uniref:PAS domain S-box-containing protein/diguanylate cyclase (GGDEF) domain-containing protein n=1 Tax=Arboricoccus pini TaxID=1963835 RepID=A0A212QQ87_9PROT|nr:GGDEF and EAL domain-containing protein [Arboricoccus pini]SNB61628.1 PAS domain S-box-containing protein/diguanylate cyclase (GGDEF) domain-containing protein [Arboricoccus pini]
MLIAADAAEMAEGSLNAWSLNGPAVDIVWIGLLATLSLACAAAAVGILYEWRRRRQLQLYLDEIREHQRDAILVIDTDGRIKRFNNAARAIFEIPREETLTGRLIADVLASKGLNGKLEMLFATPPAPPDDVHLELAGRRHDGSGLFLDVMVADFRQRERVIVFRDISTRRAMEWELGASASILRTLADHAPVIIWQRDDTSRSIYLNRHWETFTGVDVAVGQANGWYHYVHPEDRARVEAATHEAIRAMRPLEIEYRLFSRSGWRWVLDTAAARFCDDGMFAGYVGVVIDIDDRRRSVARLQESEARFRDVAMTASDMLWETDEEGRFTYLSDRAEAIIGLPPEMALGRTPWSLGLQGAPTADGEMNASWRLDTPAPFRNVTFRWSDSAQGTGRWIAIGGKPVFTAENRFAGYRGSATDVTSEVEAGAQLRHQATHDGLTGLPNRGAMLEHLTRALASGDKQGRQVGVVCLDLDRFKDVNDTFGHAAGDDLLKMVSERLTRLAADAGIVGRIGGDEFTILLSNIGDQTQLEEFCQQVIELAAEPYEMDGLRVHVGISVGGALAEGQERAEETLKRADFALYAAKREGRETWRAYTRELEGGRRSRKKLEVELRAAIEENSLSVYYQPQVDLVTHRMIAVEALTRWRRPEGDIVSPLDFIPLAEETRLIVQLGEFVLRRAATDIVPFSELALAVNLSPVQLLRTDLVQMIEEVLAQSGFAPDRLELEITESALLKDDHTVRKMMLELKQLGVKLALDDFGTGFSSLSYLQRLPFDTIKLDRSFINSLDRDPGAVSIVHAVIGLGASLGMKVVAEGVETTAQARFLRDEGCRIAQGFLFAPALPAEEVDRLRGIDLSRHRVAAA